MAYSYLPWTPDQMALLPTNPREWLTSNHLAYQVRDAVQLMDLAEFRTRLKDPRGAPGFHPEMMVSLFLYALCKNVRSSRAIAQFCLDDLGARFLVAGTAPQYRVLAKFRQENALALSQVLAQTVVLCEKAGLVDVSDLFVDGTKLKANASLRKNIAYEKIDPSLAKIEQRIIELFAQAEQADAEEQAEEQAREQARRGPEHAPSPEATLGEVSPEQAQMSQEQAQMSPEQAVMLRRRAQLRAAKARLEEEAKAKHAEYESQPASQRSHHKKPTGTPEPSTRTNLTDPDSAILQTWEKSYMQGYNGQIVVEKSHMIIVGACLTNDANDYHQLLPAVCAFEQTTGKSPTHLVADAGYFRASTIEALEQQGVDVLIPPKKVDRRKSPEPAPEVMQEPALESAPSGKELALSGKELALSGKELALSGKELALSGKELALSGKELAPLSTAQRMTAILATPDGASRYGRRMSTVEPTFGLLKGCPGHEGFRQFLSRGLPKCGWEWLLMCAVHNLKRYFACRPPVAPLRTPRACPMRCSSGEMALM